MIEAWRRLPRVRLLNESTWNGKSSCRQTEGRWLNYLRNATSRAATRAIVRCASLHRHPPLSSTPASPVSTTEHAPALPPIPQRGVAPGKNPEITPIPDLYEGVRGTFMRCLFEHRGRFPSALETSNVCIIIHIFEVSVSETSETTLSAYASSPKTLATASTARRAAGEKSGNNANFPSDHAMGLCARNG